MSVFGGIFAGMLVGFYFAEKDVPFPLKYNSRTETKAGSLELDLQIVDTLLYDIKKAVGYRSKIE